MKKKLQFYFFSLATFLFSIPMVSAARTPTADITETCENIVPPDIIEYINMFWYIILILGPVILVVMSLLDIAKTIAGGDDAAFKKVFSKIMKRVIGLIVLLVFPILLNFILGLINSGFGTCISS